MKKKDDMKSRKMTTLQQIVFKSFFIDLQIEKGYSKSQAEKMYRKFVSTHGMVFDNKSEKTT